MTRFLRPHAALAFVLVAALPRIASAQLPQGGPPGGQVGGDEEQKPEGAAEKAPTEAGQLPSTPYLPPYPGEKKKAFELIQLDGYFRLRTDWQSNYHLGFHDAGTGGTPYPEPLDCVDPTKPDVNCGKTIGSANLRLRLEPTINLSEKVAVHMQIDVLDNLVLGTTNEGTYADGTRAPGGLPIDFLTDNQASPQAGKNSAKDSVRVKRVWGDVETPVGRLKFGRMPNHWGLGVSSNGGGEDPFHDGEYCLDCDYGDTVDRIIFNAKIPGTPFTGALGMDWAAGGASNFRLFPERYDGKEADLSDSDDTTQYVFVLSDLRTADAWKDNLDAGGLGFDWGVMLTYRKQDWQFGSLGTPTTPPTFLHRNAWMYVPDAYFRFGVGKLNIEGEAVAVLGDVNDTSDLDPVAGDAEKTGDNKLLQFGGVLRLNYLMADDEFNLGFEVGSASGDQWEAAKPGETHFTRVPVLSPNERDDQATAFLFDPNYHVDLILFRELLGTVRNATYIKPNIAYDLTGRLRFKAAAILSFANVPVSTPGNSSLWGVELDGDLGYHNDKEGFFAGISYGVLFPLAAMDHPETLFPKEGEHGSASTAQTIQMRLALKF